MSIQKTDEVELERSEGFVAWIFSNATIELVHPEFFYKLEREKMNELVLKWYQQLSQEQKEVLQRQLRVLEEE